MATIKFDISTEYATTLAQTAKDAGFTKDLTGIIEYIKFLLKRTYVNQIEKEARVGVEDNIKTIKDTAENVDI